MTYLYKDVLINLINTKEGTAFKSADFVVSNITDNITATTNTTAELSPYGLTGKYGVKTVNYNRIDLSAISPIVIDRFSYTTVADILPSIMKDHGLQIYSDDIVNNSLNTADHTSLDAGTLVASKDSIVFKGSAKITYSFKCANFIYTFSIPVTRQTPLNWVNHPNYYFRVYRDPVQLFAINSYNKTFTKTTVKRFSPKYFTVNGPRSMSFSIVSDQDKMTINYTARLKNDLCGITWFSEDTKDHTNQKYSTNKDYRGTVWVFDIELSNTSPVLNDEKRAPSITVNARDASGTPVTYIIPIFRYADTPTLRTARVTIDWSTVMGGFFADQPIFAGDIDNLFIAAVVSSYDVASDPLPAPMNGSISITNVSVTGPSSDLVLRKATVGVNGLGMATSYDDSYDLTPQRIIENLLDLGYSDSINHYCGMSIFPQKTWDGTRLVIVTHDNAAGLPVVNNPTAQWHKDFARQCAKNNLRLIQAVSFETFSPDTRYDWVQRAANNELGETGYVPPSNLLSPCSVDAMNWLHKASIEFASIASAAGLEIIVQIGEPWWWYNPGTLKPCFYDASTRQKFNAQTSLIAPDFQNIFSTNVGTPYDEFKTFLRNELGNAVLGIRDAIKTAHPTAKVSILPFFPTIINKGIMEFVNYPVNQYAYPNFDIFQTEGYDWLIQDDTANIPKSMTIPLIDLGYPPSQVEYLAGFVPQLPLNARPEVWKRILKNIKDNLTYSIRKQYIWAYNIIARDSVTIVPEDGFVRFFYDTDYYRTTVNSLPITNIDLGDYQLVTVEKASVQTVGDFIDNVKAQLPDFDVFLQYQTNNLVVCRNGKTFALDDGNGAVGPAIGFDCGIFDEGSFRQQTDPNSMAISDFSKIINVTSSLTPNPI